MQPLESDDSPEAEAQSPQITQLFKTVCTCALTEQFGKGKGKSKSKETEFATEDDESDSDETTMVPGQIAEELESDVMGLDVDELRQLLTEYYVRPVLLERAARALREVCVPKNVIRPIRCLKSIQSAHDADGKWRCHKCAHFLNQPKKFAATFVSTHSLEHHKWVYISPLVPYSLMSFTAWHDLEIEMLVPDTNFVLVCPFVVFDSLTDFSTSTSAEPVLTTFTSIASLIVFAPLNSLISVMPTKI